MGVNQVVLFPAHNLGDLAGHAQVQTVSHGQIIDGRVLRLQQFGEVFGLYTCEGDLESALRQALGQQILHPFRPGIMFAVDKMQHPGNADGG